jgi:ABC-type branched-subunit amino acid transport system substrate-binding protein
MEQMMNKNRCAWVMVSVLILVFLGGCAKKRIAPAPSIPSAGGELESTTGNNGQAKAGTPAETASVVSLMQRGDQLAGVGNSRAALDIYGVALTRASGNEKVLLLDSVESVLLKCDVDLLREIMAGPDRHFPPALVLYALGYRYAARGEKDLSREVLQSYIHQYPHGRRVDDARQLMEILTVKKEEGVKIGCLLPLSGKYAVFGQRALKGVQVALARLIPRYGDGIRLIIRDTASDNETALQRMQELMDARVMAIVGPMVTAQSVAGVAQAHGIPMIAMTQKDTVARSGEYVFSNFITPAMQVQSLISHAMIHLGVRQFAVLHPRDKYGETLMRLFCDRVEEMGGEVRKVVAYDGRHTDFSKEIKRVAGFDDPGLQASLRRSGGGKSVHHSDRPVVNFEALFIPDAPSRLALILPQLIYNDVTDIVLLGTNIWHRPLLVQQAGPYVRNAVITEGYFSDSHREGARRFKDAFVGMFGASPKFIEAIAHDTVSMLVETVMDPTVTSSKTLKDALTGTRIFDGATGKTLFDRDGQLHKELFFLTVKNGVFVEITR